MRGFLAAVIALATICGSAAQAGDNPVVVELYTSQGCSSCPPADRLLAELGRRHDVIPLALHVDYWDYIGWEDVYAKRAFTMRQKGYARASGHRTIYTPQMIVGGEDHLVGHKPMKLAELIQEHRDRPKQVRLNARRIGGTLKIRAEALSEPAGKAVVQLVRYMPEGTVEIGHGENAGKTITYTHIVTDWSVLGGWDGTGPLKLDIPLEDDAPAVVILQKTGHGPIIAAARVELP